MVYGVIESVELGWGQPLVFGSSIAGVACLIVFVFFEGRVLGIVMVTAFSSSLNRTLGGTQLPPGVLQYIQSNEIKLAGLDVPTGLDADTTALIRVSISHAFVFGFRTAMLICVCLSLASAAAAWRMIPAKTK